MPILRLSFSLLLLCCCGCVSWQPVQINSSDPSLAAQQQMESKTDSDDVKAFIVNHPELDAETKKELRDGTITIHEALERLKKNPSTMRP